MALGGSNRPSLGAQLGILTKERASVTAENEQEFVLASQGSMRIDRHYLMDDPYKGGQLGNTVQRFEKASTKGYSSMKGSRGHGFGHMDGTTVGLHHSVAYSTA